MQALDVTEEAFRKAQLYGFRMEALEKVRDERQQEVSKTPELELGMIADGQQLHAVRDVSHNVATQAFTSPRDGVHAHKRPRSSPRDKVEDASSSSGSHGHSHKAKGGLGSGAQSENTKASDLRSLPPR